MGKKMNKTPVLAFFLILTAATTFGAVSAIADSGLYNKGLLALKSGDAQAAVRLISKALEFDPSNYRYYNDRGVAHKKGGDLEKALADYSRALDIRPDYTNALNNRGVVFLQTGDFDKAIQDFTEALRFGGIESTVHTNLGIAYARKGDLQKAVKEFDSAIARPRTDPRAFLFLAESLEQMGDKERSLKLYQRARTASTDPTVAAGIEKRIAVLEKTGAARTAPAAIEQKDKTRPLGGRRVVEPPQSTQSRGIQLARPLPSPAPAPNLQNREPTTGSAVKPQKAVEPKIESLQELDRKSRVKAVEKFSPASREIFVQGIQFVEQSDPAKALIRFEDCLQLEKRSKDSHGVAWNSLEIGRVHAKLGDHLKAAGYLEEALKYFSAHKAADEVILALVELAANRKAVGQKEKGSQYLAHAIEESSAKGYTNLAAALQDLALGRTPKPVEQKAAEKPKTDTHPKVASAAPIKIAAGEEQRKNTPEQTKTVAKDQQKTSAAEKTQKSEPSKGKTVKETVPAQQSAPIQDYRKLETVGRGPVIWGNQPQNQAMVRPQVDAKKAPVESSAQSHTQLPERMTLTLKNPVPPDQRVPSDNAHRVANAELKKLAAIRQQSPTGAPAGAQKMADNTAKDQTARQKSIKEDLVELRKLRRAGDEANMIVVLERISGKFAKSKDYEKALHGLAASLAFREKIGKRDALDTVLSQSGLMKEKMGDLSGALEDFTHVMVLGQSESKTSRAAAQSARATASRMRLDPGPALDSLQRFWRSRAVQDNQSETQALYSVAKIYDKAERHQDALNYYDRAGASVLADKARVYEKIGKSELADQAYAQALEAFRRLDYSRYMHMKMTPKRPNTLSRD
jgi:tetratricopeptide (TPR) repeat protein